MKGNKPSFHNAMDSSHSETFYREFIDIVKESYNASKVKDGVFGAYMDVSINNDGPVTIQFESPRNSMQQ